MIRRVLVAALLSVAVSGCALVLGPDAVTGLSTKTGTGQQQTVQQKMEQVRKGRDLSKMLQSSFTRFMQTRSITINQQAEQLTHQVRTDMASRGMSGSGAEKSQLDSIAQAKESDLVSAKQQSIADAVTDVRAILAGDAVSMGYALNDQELADAIVASVNDALPASGIIN